MQEEVKAELEQAHEEAKAATKAGFLSMLKNVVPVLLFVVRNYKVLVATVALVSTTAAATMGAFEPLVHAIAAANE